MENLPCNLTINGIDYVFVEQQFSEHAKILPNWWSVGYDPIGGGLPPWVHNKHEWYYLCTTAPTKEEALADLTERVTTMILD